MTTTIEQTRPIYSTNEFNLYKTTRNTYMIKLFEPNEKLMNSITKPNFLLDTTVSTDNKTLIINAKDIISLVDYKKKNKKELNTSNLNYEDCLHSLYSLTKQLEYLLKNESSCFYNYEPDKVLIINNHIYLYISTSHLVELNKNKNKLKLTSPFDIHSHYLCPEIRIIKTLPAEINYKAVYYSLGLLIINLLNETENEDTGNKEKKINEIMKPIEGTKLYYYLMRCIEEDVERRTLLFI
jgi:hypothetical protein